VPVAPPTPAAPQPTSGAPQPIKTVPLTNSGSVIVSAAGNDASKASPVKTVPLASAPPAPSMSTSVLAPPSSKPNSSVGTVLKTQALNSPQAPNPPGLATQPMDDPKPASFTPPPTPSAPLSSSPTASRPVASHPVNTQKSNNFKTHEEVNPNKGWPLAAVALFVATVSLVVHIMGYTIWNQ